MNILLTGATGFVGRHTAADLISRGYEVYGLVRDASPRRSLLPERLHTVDMDLSELRGSGRTRTQTERHLDKAYTGCAAEISNEASCADIAADAAGCEVKEPESLHTWDALPEIDVCIHLAWEGAARGGRMDAQLQQDNVENTMALIRAVADRGCRRFVFSGSQAEYGVTTDDARQSHTRDDVRQLQTTEDVRQLQTTEDTRQPQTTDDARQSQTADGSQRSCTSDIYMTTERTPCHPRSEYGRAKLEVLHRASELCRELDMTYIHMRLFSIYGSDDQPNSLISQCARAFARGETMTTGSSCDQMWNFLHVDDCAAAISLLVSCPYLTDTDEGETACVVNVAGAHSRILREYIEEMAQLAEPRGRVVFGKGMSSPEGIPYLAPDISRLTAATGFAQRVSWQDGIRDVLRAAGLKQS